MPSSSQLSTSLPPSFFVVLWAEMGGLSSYFFPTSSSTNNLTRSTTITSETSTRSSTSSHHGTSSTRSSTSTLPSSSSFSNLIDAAKDYVFGEPAVFYPPSNQAKSLREAKEDLGDLEAGVGWASDQGGGGLLARRMSVGSRTTPSSRSRASSTASSTSSVAAIVSSSFSRAQAAGFSSSDSAEEETDTIRGRGRRKSISSNHPPRISFADTVRTHRRSRSATPSDRGRLPPSASCPTGFKLLSPLPELPRSSNRSVDSRASSTSPTSTIHSFGGEPSTPTRRRPTSPSVKSSGTLTEGGETDEEEEQMGGRNTFEGRGSLKFTFGGGANQSELSLASSSGSGGGRPSSPTKRSLQGRRMVGTRSYTGTPPTSTMNASYSTDVSRSSTPVRPSPPTMVIELVVPSTSPIPPKLELPPLPRSTTTSTFRPRSRRTYSLPFAPHLEPPSASSLSSSPSTGNSSSSSIASGSNSSSRSPFFDPTSSLKADQPATTLNTTAQPASLSTFSSWTFPEEAKEDAQGGEEQPQTKHRVLAPLRSYDLTSAGIPASSSTMSLHPFPTIPLSSGSSSSASASQHVRTPSSSPSLSFNSPGRRPVNVERALSQPLPHHSSRSLSKSLSSSTSSFTSSSTGSSPPTMGPPPVPLKPGGGLRRATTISSAHPSSYHVRTNSRSTSPAMTSSPPMIMGGGGGGASGSTFAFPSSSSNNALSFNHNHPRPQPKLRLPQSYSFQSIKDSSSSDYPPLPYSSRSYAPSSPSGSSDAGSAAGGGGDLPWIPPLAGRRGSHSSQSSLRMEVHPFEDQHQYQRPTASSSSSNRARGGSVGTEARPGLWRSASSAVSLTNLLSGGGLGRKSSLRESTTERERKAEEERVRERVRREEEEEEEEEEEYITFRKGL
ncbi:hypothetical protein BDY24DRAFT_417765 [Mrakia frigida]|uniref:uncharacterized protein n=1 Tax=Mrakia frigida TaxID=29902 RepID=UPI003FCBFB82